METYSRPHMTWWRAGTTPISAVACLNSASPGKAAAVERVPDDHPAPSWEPQLLRPRVRKELQGERVGQGVESPKAVGGRVSLAFG